MNLKNLKIREEVEPNQYMILTEDQKDWVAHVKFNGHFTVQKQQEMLKRYAVAEEMFELIETIENDNNQIPEWLWVRIKNLVQKTRN